jgi:hypothetical protein
MGWKHKAAFVVRHPHHRNRTQNTARNRSGVYILQAAGDPKHDSLFRKLLFHTDTPFIDYQAILLVCDLF